MKIGIVCYPTYGGSGVVATELGMALAEKGHKVHFISYREPFRLDPFHPNSFYHEVRVKDYPLFDYPPYELVLSSKLVDVAIYEQLDLFHVHYAIPHASAAYMAQKILADRGIHIPFITTLHGTDITLVGKDPSFKPAISFAINHSNAVTAVSESLKRDTYMHFDISNEIQVIPNFVCVDMYERNGASDAYRNSVLEDGEKLIVHVSNFRKVKRVQDVVKTFALLREKVPGKLVLVGDGPERSGMEALCRELGTCDDTIFVGKVKDVDKLVGAADLFLLTSESESFGLAALEAMALGVPVISTNTGGIPEVNLDGVTGFTSDVGDVENMADNAVKLLTDDKLHRQFRDSAIEQARKFDIGKILPHYEALYESLL